MEQLLQMSLDINKKLREVEEMNNEFYREVLKVVGQDELFGNESDNQNGDSNFEREQ